MGFRRLPIFCWIVMCACFVSHPLFSQTYTSDAQNGITQLQTWYLPSTGIYASPSGWWNGANSMTLLSNYERATNDDTLYPTLLNSFNVASVANHHTDYENFYYDDTSWWTLAWIQAYDLTGDPSYLSMAETIFNGFLINGWNPATCGGGEYWAINSNYKNAIANELFLTVAAKLANRTSGTDSANYLSWANKEWTWFKNSGMINSSNLINDGITPPTANPPCVNNQVTTWTYNQGVVLGGLVELAQANNDPSLITEAQTLAHATLTSSLVNANGVLVESSISGGDAPQFKGIFARNLMYLNDAVNNPEYTSFLNTNANSIWANDQGPNYELGGLWQGPFDSADATRQTSALDAMVGAVDAQAHSSVGPIETDTAGSQEMFAVDESGNIWQDAQLTNSHGASAPSNWTGWNEFPMGGMVSRAGAVVAENGIREQYVFAPSATGDVYVMSESNPAGGWGSWTDMGAGSKGMTDLRAIYTYNGGLYLFGRDRFGNLHYASLSNPNASWTAFAGLPGRAVQSGYVVGKNAVSGYLQVFGVDGWGRVWTNIQTGQTTWSGWTAIRGVPLQGYLTIAQDLSGNLHLFGIDFLGNVWTNYQSTNGGSWQNQWQRLGLPWGHTFIRPGFVCGINADGALELFGVGYDGKAYSLSQANGVWSSSWSSLGGDRLNPDLMVTTTADGRLQTFGTSDANSHDVYSNWQTTPGGSWNGWEDFGGSGYRLYAGY
jgi:predicted alpha-1,6-mannanase (GH76 family)